MLVQNGVRSITWLHRKKTNNYKKYRSSDFELRYFCVYFIFFRPTIFPESRALTFVNWLLLYLYNVPSSERRLVGGHLTTLFLRKKTAMKSIIAVNLFTFFQLQNNILLSKSAQFLQVQSPNLHPNALQSVHLKMNQSESLTIKSTH